MLIPFERVMTLVREVDAAGRCSHPIRLTGVTRNAMTGEFRTRTVKVPCKDRRAVVCPSCSALYQTDAWILVASGLNGGKGVSPDVASHPSLFATLTAPSFGQVHSTGPQVHPCRPRRAHGHCGHDLPTWCDLVHIRSDEALGAPLCPSCMDARGAVLWNAMASVLWDRTMVRLRRSLAMEAGLPATSLRQVAHAEFLKVAEVQRRGLVHFHALLRADGPGGPATEPPAWLTTSRMAESFVSAVRSAKVTDPLGGTHRWGNEFDIAEIDSQTGSDRRVACYVAKYATKTTGGSVALAHRFASRGEIEHAKVAAHHRQLALMAWDLEREPELMSLRLRRHAHALGYRGQLVTKSRGYSTTFARLRTARLEYRSKTTGDDPVRGSFGYTGRGYDDPLSAPWAEALAEARVEHRRSVARTRKEQGDRDQVGRVVVSRRRVGNDHDAGPGTGTGTKPTLVEMPELVDRACTSQ